MFPQISKKSRRASHQGRMASQFAKRLLWGWANGRQKHTQPVQGPFRPNVRRMR